MAFSGLSVNPSQFTTAFTPQPVIPANVGLAGSAGSAGTIGLPSAGFGATSAPGFIGGAQFQPQNPVMQLLSLILGALFQTGNGFNQFLGGQPQQNPYQFQQPQQFQQPIYASAYAGGGNYGAAGSAGYGGGYSYGGPQQPQQAVAVAYTPPPTQTAPPAPQGGGGGGYGG